MREDTNLEFINIMDLIQKKIKKWIIKLEEGIEKKIKDFEYCILLTTCKKFNKIKYLNMAYHHNSKRIRKKYRDKIIKLFYENKNLFTSKELYDAYISVSG